MSQQQHDWYTELECQNLALREEPGLQAFSSKPKPSHGFAESSVAHRPDPDHNGEIYHPHHRLHGQLIHSPLLHVIHVGYCHSYRLVNFDLLC